MAKIDKRIKCPHGCNRIVLQSRMGDHYLFTHVHAGAVEVTDIIKENRRKDAQFAFILKAVR